jgi:dTDP-4-amino-4,6-dideoxygalactose transaminase
MTGTFGDIGCFSFYPSKNLGAFGDAGAIVTDNEEIAKEFRIYRNYGSEKRYYNKVVGTNSRLDELQAGLLRVRLSHIQELTKERETLCNRYLSKLNNSYIELPKVLSNSTTVWHQFVIRSKKRDELIQYLNEHDIGTIIHYPIPPHLSEAYQYLGFSKGDYPITEQYADEVLSIPLYNGMTEEEQDYVIDTINKFGERV